MNQSSIRLAVLTVVLTPMVVLAWGFDGHRRLAANIQAPLPQSSCLRGWITANQNASFQERATEPDRWRDRDPAEAPRHYLDIDWADPVWSYPREWTAVEAKFGEFAAKNGQVPWRVEELYGKLVQNFKDGNSAAALITVAHLSHYVTDAFSILHNTKESNPHWGPEDADGLHSRWESDMLDSRANIDGLTKKMAQYFGTLGRAEPTGHIFDVIITGNGLVQELVGADVATKGDLVGLYAATEELTARRWGDSLTLLASLIGSAWVDAGSPTLAGMSTGCSKDVAQGEIVLKGYAFPVPPPDVGPTVPTHPANPGTEPTSPGQNPEEGKNDVSPRSGCSAAPGVLALPFLLGLFGIIRRSRR